MLRVMPNPHESFDRQEKSDQHSYLTNLPFNPHKLPNQSTGTVMGRCLRDTLSLGVRETEAELSRAKALLRGHSEPPHRPHGVLGHALAIVVHEAEVALSLGEAVLGGLAIPPHQAK